MLTLMVMATPFVIVRVRCLIVDDYLAIEMEGKIYFNGIEGFNLKGNDPNSREQQF